MRRGHKYGAKKTTLDGFTFDSKAEATYYLELKLLKKAKKILDFELQPRFELLPPFTKNGVKYRKTEYVGDFLVTHLDGSREVVDVKGKKTPVYEIKRKMFEYRYPELTIKEVSA